MINDYFSIEEIHDLSFKYLIPFPRVHVPELETVPYEEFLRQFTVSQIENRA